MTLAAADLHPAVSDAEFKRFLRYPPRRTLEGALAENAAWARAWFARHAHPWFFARRISLRAAIGAAAYDATAQPARFSGVVEAFAVAASAGPEIDAEAAARWTQDEPDRYFFLESYASAVTEKLLSEAARRIAALPEGLAVFPHYCPGFAGWPATDAPRFLSLVRGLGELTGPLEALASGALRPKKSKLALIAVAPRRAPVAA